MTRARFLFTACVGGWAAALLLAFLHPFGNAETRSASGSAREWGRDGMPSAVRTILAAKCADCHSLERRIPVYGHFAPASWIIERDVLRARAAVNLSQWDSESPDDKQTMMGQIAHAARLHKMPPPQYVALHWTARLTDTEVHTIIDWTESAGGVPVSQTDEAGPGGDARRGKAVFEKRCTGCHALDQNREGPRLRGVYGRTAASVNGFDYSSALKNSHIVWNEATLSRWLTNPDSVAPGNNMDFYVANPGERADVIQFLKEQSAK